MAMATSISILVGALLLAGLAATAHGEVDTTANNIRLPSEGKTDRPWDCCTNIEQSPFEVFPPLYRCNDEVKQCGAACQSCVEAPGDFPRAWICRDWYQTADPGPLCVGPTNKNKPWKCCDDLVKSPAKIFPPLWHCNDEVSKCDANCTECVARPGDLPRQVFVCNDWYWGVNPGPICKARPWGKCCDNTVCTKSLPPICSCTDEVRKCAATCKRCQRVASSDPPRYVCMDQYTGNPGRKCSVATN
ncbi:hypothetical protein GUJ93_ZPchr0008g13371 [Zizania palustris]|uniref:Bowman-Birk serine protease inhibitors family domain-containing protein n=1 Tax=Zizania palustris TaxID=103762 RepID=A0A8J5RVK4_ZIZPA|nr:hypothetical protein GUJ93_ZPchr0008g13371 [Zizania palustris]